MLGAVPHHDRVEVRQPLAQGLLYVLVDLLPAIVRARLNLLKLHPRAYNTFRLARCCLAWLGLLMHARHVESQEGLRLLGEICISTGLVLHPTVGLCTHAAYYTEPLQESTQL